MFLWKFGNPTLNVATDVELIIFFFRYMEIYKFLSLLAKQQSDQHRAPHDCAIMLLTSLFLVHFQRDLLCSTLTTILVAAFRLPFGRL